MYCCMLCGVGKGVGTILGHQRREDVILRQIIKNMQQARGSC